MRIRKGDIVGRKSYNKDIFFIVDRIIKLKNKEQYAILKGVDIRIEADAPIEDIEKIETSRIISAEKRIDELLRKRIISNKNIYRKYISKTGKILHLDGDKRYSEKSTRYYKKVGLNAVVRNISERNQTAMVLPLLNKYNPDVLVITRT